MNKIDQTCEDIYLVSNCKKELPYDTRSFTVLLEKHEQMVLNLSYYLLGNQCDANEVAQDVFLRVFHNIGSFKGNSTFKTWLAAITKNLCLTRISKNNKEKLNKELYADHINQENTIKENNSDFTPMTDVLMKLPFIYKEIISLRHISDLKIREIAEMMFISESAVKMRYSRGIELLKDELSHTKQAKPRVKSDG